MLPHDESREALWALFLGPTIWAAHFLLSYGTAAVWCAKAAGGDFVAVRIAVALYTAAALALIALSAHRGFRRHRYGEPAAPPHDADSDADRHRFLGFASLLLCGLAAVATLYGAMVVAFIQSCR
ncbi:MAG: hypothetical protein AB1651_10565 [Pseudomonadota bacterium]